MAEQPQHVSADRGSYAAGRDINKYGLDEDQVAALVAKAVAENSQNVPRSTILELANRVAPRTDDLEQALNDLRNALDIAARMRRRVGAPSNLDPFVDAVMAELDVLNEKGEFDDGVAVVDRAVAAAEARLEREQAAFAEILNVAIDQHLLAFDANGAATKIARRVDLEASDPADRFDALRRERDTWYKRGRDKGLNLDLSVAIALAEIARNRADTPDQKGVALNDLGAAFQTLGQRESYTERLEEAVAAYRAALKEHTRDRNPLDWAMTQMNLGAALYTLGDRESGTGRLEEAAAAFRAALEERPRDRVPLGWARTQVNLGNALATLGDRESGTDRLEEAAAAFRAALEELTRDRVPLDWATTQMNLGTALRALGEREVGTDRLEEAVAACRAALEEWTRDRVPLDWARTQMNLGTALRVLGERESGTDRLEEAVAAFRAALEELTRDRAPLDWAMTRGNIASVHIALFDKTSNVTELDRAQAAINDALEVFARAEASQYLSIIAIIQVAIDARRGG